jgi:hypothetical protein
MAVPATGGWPLPRSLWIQDQAFMQDPGDWLSRFEPFRCSLNVIFYDILLAGSLYKKYFANMCVSCNLQGDIIVAIYILSRMKRRYRLDPDGQHAETFVSHPPWLLFASGTINANCAQLTRSVSKFIFMRAAPNRLGGTGTPHQKISPTREKGGPVCVPTDGAPLGIASAAFELG